MRAISSLGVCPEVMSVKVVIDSYVQPIQYLIEQVAMLCRSDHHAFRPIRRSQDGDDRCHFYSFGTRARYRYRGSECGSRWLSPWEVLRPLHAS